MGKSFYVVAEMATCISADHSSVWAAALCDFWFLGGYSCNPPNIGFPSIFGDEALDWRGFLNHNWKLAIVIGRLIAAALCVVGAVFLMFKDKDGWGWLLFLAFCLGSISWADEQDELEEEV